MKFQPGASSICGGSCATAFGYDRLTGVVVSFDSPFPKSSEYLAQEIITSAGPIYLKLNTVNSTQKGDQNSLPVKILDKVEHYSCSEIKLGKAQAQVGMCLLIDLIPYYELVVARMTCGPDKDYYLKIIEHNKTHQKELEAALATNLIYKSPPFYNSVHLERKYPSCILYIYDKEMKNE